MSNLHKNKLYYFVMILFIINAFLAACGNNRNKSYDFKEIRVDCDNYLFVAGIDSQGNIIVADGDSFIIFDDSLNVLKNIPHNIKEPFGCSIYDNNLYVTTISQNDIYLYSLQDNQLLLQDKLSTGLSNASILRMRAYEDVLYFLVLFKDTDDLSIYSYEFESESITKLDVSGVEWFDCINDKELLISSNVNDKATLSVYNVITRAIEDIYSLKDQVKDFTYTHDMHILNIHGGKQLISSDLKDGIGMIIYHGAKNALLSGYIQKNGDYYYFCDTANQLLIKLPIEGIYQSTYTPIESEEIIEASISDQGTPEPPPIPGHYSINQEAIDEELAKIEPVSEEDFELVILTDKYSMPNKGADAIYQRKYPNATIKYELIPDSALVKENGNPYESEYDRQLKLKLLANESDFDLFYIKSPETLTQVVHSGGYLDLSATKIQECMSRFFEGVVKSCTYNDAVFGLPVYTTFSGLQVNDELVRAYEIDYPFKKEPLKFYELPAFAEKYCKDYDEDGKIDVHLTTAHEATLEDGTKSVFNSLVLNTRYETSYINYFRKEGLYQPAILRQIDEVNKLLEPYCLNTQNILDPGCLFFGPAGVYRVNPFDNSPVTYLPVFEDKEVYGATYEYLCGNKFSDKKEYIIEYLSCIGDALNLSDRNLIYKDPTVYEKYFSNVQIDREHFDFYQRIVDHSVPSAILSWDSLRELHDAMDKDRKLYDEGQISLDTLYERYNQKLELIFNE